MPHRVNALSPIIDPEIVSVVDLAQLRSLCSHGKSADCESPCRRRHSSECRSAVTSAVVAAARMEVRAFFRVAWAKVLRMLQALARHTAR